MILLRKNFSDRYCHHHRRGTATEMDWHPRRISDNLTSHIPDPPPDLRTGANTRNDAQLSYWHGFNIIVHPQRLRNISAMGRIWWDCRLAGGITGLYYHRGSSRLRKYAKISVSRVAPYHCSV